jgi:RNA 3'-terminal phosphate cyclase (ATP)
METVFIDGSMGEGGGQILRTSLALACITGRNLHIENIRAARRNPGLAKQHLSCVRAACEICGGQCKGAAIGSQALDFQPGSTRSGDFSFDIGSAGSATLVIQTILPALFLADRHSTVTVTGGTHNPWAPPYDFLAETFLPVIKTAGFEANCKLVKYGFYPAGGGKIAQNLKPRQQKPNQKIDFCQQSENIQIYARIYTAKLSAHIAQRQKKLLLQSKLKFTNIEHIEVTDSDGPGNCVMIRLMPASSQRDGDGIPRTTVFTAFGQKGKPSEKVVGEVVNLAEDFLPDGAAIDRFLADQLLIYMAINSHFAKDSKTGTLGTDPSLRSGRLRAHASGGLLGGSFTTNELSTHLTTNIETIKKFLPVDFKTEYEDGIYRISCKLV